MLFLFPGRAVNHHSENGFLQHSVKTDGNSSEITESISTDTKEEESEPHH
jgi:hypothetical protein